MKDIKLKEIEAILEQYTQKDNYKLMECGDRYYKGEHDILNRNIYGLDNVGNKVILRNVPNNKLIDNQFRGALDQKVNYLLSKNPSFSTQNKDYNKELLEIFNNKFLKTLFLLGKDCYKFGISWLYIYYNENGILSFKKFDSREIIPVWKNDEHMELDYVIRKYKSKQFNGKSYEEIENVEIYTPDGIEYLTLKNNKLISNKKENYIKLKDKEFNWAKIPIIAFKANEDEIPLIKAVKSIQDAINEIMSDYKNDMEQNSRNTILVIKNYAEIKEFFRQSLNNSGVIFVDEDGGIDKLNIEVNATNYESILTMLKKALIENAKSFDAKSDKLGSNPNQMNIQSMYSDMDLDANAMEREFQHSMELLLWFINQHLLFTKNIDYTQETVEVIFNRDILVNEAQAIDDCVKSINILSRETVISQHPWVKDVELELKRLEEAESIYGEYEENSYLNHSHGDVS